jgi:Ca-activated chloride channel family protein
MSMCKYDNMLNLSADRQVYHCNDVRQNMFFPSSFKYIVLLLFTVHYSLFATAQEERSLTREGNKYFDKQKYSDAEASYKKAIEKKSNKQGRYDDAKKQFEMAAKLLTNTNLKAQSYHNMGNCSMEKKEYEEAVKSYKEALKLNPRDKDTKYNLAYANAKLREDQKNKQNKQDKKQNKDNKDDKKNQDKKDQDKKGQQNKDGQGDKDQKPKKGNGKELSKEQADKLLEALKAEEQKTQEKMQKKQAKPQDVKIEKDW